MFFILHSIFEVKPLIFLSLLEAFDNNLCFNTLQKLQRGEQAVIQEYSFKKHSRLGNLLVFVKADDFLYIPYLVLLIQLLNYLQLF